MIFKVMVEPFLGGSNANAPTQSDSKLYDRQSYSAQAKEVALGAGLGKLGGQLLGKFLGPIWRKLRGAAGASDDLASGGIKGSNPISTAKPTVAPAPASKPHSLGAAAAVESSDATIAAHAAKHWPKLTREQLIAKIGEVRREGSMIRAPNGNKLTFTKDGTVLIDDFTSFEGGTIFRPSDKIQRYITRWLEDNP